MVLVVMRGLWCGFCGVDLFLLSLFLSRVSFRFFVRVASVI